MMANVLADMAVEVEASTLMALRVAKATDCLDTSPQEKALARVATPVAKYVNCSRVVVVANEALQCHGGNGFVEDHPMARLYREAPLNSVWEGAANMMCMDVRRAMLQDPNCRDALLAELADVRGQDTRFDGFINAMGPLLDEMQQEEFLARPATEVIARALQGAELLRHSTPEVIDVFMKTRLGGGTNHWGVMFGTLGPGVRQAQADRIVDRACVKR